MEYRLLGRSGLKVSTITMGTMTFGGKGWAKTVGDLGVSEARRLVDMCVDAGVNLIDTAEYELLPISVDQGLGVLVWSPIAGGLLSGKHRRDQAAPEGTRQFAGWSEPPIRDENRLWNIVEALVDIGKERGVSAARVALSWLLDRPGVTSVIVGGRTAEQFKDNLAAAELKLTAGERAQLDSVSAPPLLYPYWHQRNTATDRLSAADRVALGPHLSTE